MIDIKFDAQAYDVYKIYNALRLHFTSNYDYIKYRGATRTNKEAFLMRKDKFFFYKLARKYDKDEMFNFLLVNLRYEPTIWVGKLLDEESHNRYKEWQKVVESISYHFKNDIEYLFDKHKDLDDIARSNNGQWPQLILEYVGTHIKPETMVILDTILNLFSVWKKKVVDDVVFPKIIQNLEKYEQFFVHHFDEQKMLEILAQKVKEHIKEQTA